jgi:hypothetical protein
MPELDDAFAPHIVRRVETQGFAVAITTLNAEGDTPGAKARYASVAARLTSFGTIVRGQPSTAALTPIIALC